jgi:hypothetical protein
MNYDKTRGKMRFQVGKLKKACQMAGSGDAGAGSAGLCTGGDRRIIRLFFNKMPGYGVRISAQPPCVASVLQGNAAWRRAVEKPSKAGVFRLARLGIATDVA